MDEKWKIEMYENARGDKPVEEFWEYRIIGSDNIRIFYVAVTGKIFLLLHGFKKKKQKTPTKEIRIAEERLQEYLIRKLKK